MRYFRDGNRVARLDTDAKISIDDEFFKVKAQHWTKAGVWGPHDPNLTAAILFTGDWDPIDKGVAAKIIFDEADEIDEITDWQLAQRRPVDIIVTVCRVCLTQWTSTATVCPECETVQ
jgi:hypothetical protein